LVITVRGVPFITVIGRFVFIFTPLLPSLVGFSPRTQH